jgi:hypothetical protein
MVPAIHLCIWSTRWLVVHGVDMWGGYWTEVLQRGFKRGLWARVPSVWLAWITGRIETCIVETCVYILYILYTSCGKTDIVPFLNCIYLFFKNDRYRSILQFYFLFFKNDKLPWYYRSSTKCSIFELLYYGTL